MKTPFMLVILCITLAFYTIACLQPQEKEPEMITPDEYYLKNSTKYPDFKQKQLGFERVRIAYRDAKSAVSKKLAKTGLKEDGFDLFFRVFKKEEVMELWVRPKSSNRFVLLESYPFCNNSGDLGPKRRQGDLQIPEGFYHIAVFNPASSYFLSLGVNYPNASDKILGYKPALGGDIYFHGGCATVGCVPITDEMIKEVYITAVEAKASGQDKIPVHIFPARMTPQNMKWLKRNYEKHHSFWENLKPGYDYFEENKKLPKVKVKDSGLYGY